MGGVVSKITTIRLSPGLLLKLVISILLIRAYEMLIFNNFISTVAIRAMIYYL
jgi:hypothetical protein